MSSPAPLVTADDLATLLKDPTIDRPRAEAIIADVQTLCASIVTLTSACSVVVKRVAARAYVSTVSPRAPQMGAGGSPFGGGGGNPGGVVLYKSDKADLRRLAGGSSAYSVDMLPDTYALPSNLPYWDADAVVPGDAGVV